MTFDEPMDPSHDHGLDGHASRPGRGRGRARDRQLAGTTATLDPSADLDHEHAVHGHGRRLGGGHLGERARDGRHLDVHDADRGRDRHDRRRLRRRHDREPTRTSPRPATARSSSRRPSALSSAGRVCRAAGPARCGPADLAGSTSRTARSRSTRPCSRPIVFYASGRSLEFAANFSDPNQHIGFANDFNNGQWAIFSTGADRRSAVRAQPGPGRDRYAARRERISTACTDTGSSGRRRRSAT